MPSKSYVDRQVVRASGSSTPSRRGAGESVVTGPVRRSAGVADPVPPKAASGLTPPAPRRSKGKTQRTVAVPRPPRAASNKKPVAKSPIYAVAPLPLSSGQIEDIDSQRRLAFENVLGARAEFDEAMATTELNNQLGQAALRRQTSLAAQEAAARAGARGVATSPAVMQRAAAALQAQADSGFAELAGSRASRIADLRRQLQRARGAYDSDLARIARLEGRYRGNPSGLMGMG